MSHSKSALVIVGLDYPQSKWVCLDGLAGANRGIGLKLLETFVHHGWTATGTVRPQTLTDPSVDDVRDHHIFISIETRLIL